MAPSLTLVARQPILDAAGRLHAHELLFRGDAGAKDGGGERATALVLVSTFLEAPLDEMTGGRPAWVNVSREFLLRVDPLPLPAGRVVLELLEDQVADDALVARLGDLRRAGHRIALDDFTWGDGAERLLEHASYVKLDVRALGLDGFAALAERLRPFAVELVAEKVETAAEAAAVVGLGATLLQGFFYARPELMGARPSAGRMTALRSAVGLCTSAEFDDVERALRSDPALGARVLRFLNAAGSTTTRTVDSMRQALVLVGPRVVAQWAATLLLSDLAEHRRATLAATLLRAALCERLAGPAAEQGYVVGMLSALDALLGVPLAEVLAGLPLSPVLRDAALHRAGPLGEALGAAVRIAEGDGARTPHEAAALRDALAWADAAMALG